MNKLFLALACVVAMLSINSCKEEEEEPTLLLSVESISNPENVKINYYSPDPGCVPKMYWIEANSCSSQLVLRCADADAIFFQASKDELSETYTCPEGQWEATVTDANTVTFTFHEIDQDKIDESYSVSRGFTIVAETNKGRLRTTFDVMRLTKYTLPL